MIYGVKTQAVLIVTPFHFGHAGELTQRYETLCRETTWFHAYQGSMAARLSVLQSLNYF